MTDLTLVPGPARKAVMIENKFSLDQEKFANNAIEYWKKIEEGDSRAANLAEKRNKKIVSQLGSVASNFLAPLLSYPLDEVRFAAAAYLMNTDSRNQAALILRELAQNPTGFLALSARAILEIHETAN